MSLVTDAAERALLLRIARDAIAAHVSPPSREALRRGLAEARWWTGGRAESGRQSAVDSQQSAVGSQQSAGDSQQSAISSRRAGVFVTLHIDGELRGCIGHIEADEPLPRSVARYAVAASSEDPRFAPVKAAELAHLEVEISLLGPMERAAGPADIEIGRHGLMIEMAHQRGLLLPQVASERQWDAATFLAQTCRKAGLAPDSWQRGATVWKFEAEVFGENPET